MQNPKSGLNCNKYTQSGLNGNKSAEIYCNECTKSGLNGNKSSQLFSRHLFQMLMGNTNAIPMPLNPSRFAAIEWWAAESPPSRTALAVRHLRHDQLWHRHNCQNCPYWCWSRFSTSCALRISSLAGAECSRSNSIRYLTRKVANGGIQKQLSSTCSLFGDSGQDLAWSTSRTAQKRNIITLEDDLLRTFHTPAATVCPSLAWM